VEKRSFGPECWLSVYLQFKVLWNIFMVFGYTCWGPPSASPGPTYPPPLYPECLIIAVSYGMLLCFK